ncbi:MAG TPA: putative glycolipid-binding domain-containing protein [Candidatus Angelobacter sp.]|nr:putative glycolipid-binding domain-containing protein [Candidatus Angelobacter sp.]
MNTHLIRTGLWRWLQGAGMERFEFLRAGEEWIFRGAILTQSGEAAAEARYELACDHLFHTRRATVSLRTAATEQTLEITAEHGRWFANGQEVPSVSGAIDIDLSWSPSTNTLPIRRLNLAPGHSSGEIIAAWVRFPELTLQPLAQEYLRISQDRYRYSSRGGSFTAELLVDSDGLVMDYGNFWQRVQNI